MLVSGEKSCRYLKESVYIPFLKRNNKKLVCVNNTSLFTGVKGPVSKEHV